MVIFCILSTIELLTPEGICAPNEDIVIIFESPIDTTGVKVFLDGKRIYGELTNDYFLYTPNTPYSSKMHKIVFVKSDIRKVWRFKVEKKGGLNINFSGSFSNGIEINTEEQDTLGYTSVYPSGNFYISNLFCTLISPIGEMSISGTIDPEYYGNYYILTTLKKKNLTVEGGVISPIFSEISLYGPTGLGMDVQYSTSHFTIYPFFFISSLIDTIFMDYPRRYRGVNMSLLSNKVKMNVLLFDAQDDTGAVVDFPVEMPEKSILISPSLIYKTATSDSLYLNFVHTRTDTNIFLSDEYTSGNAISTGNAISIGYSANKKNLSFNLEVRGLQSHFLTLGNPYLYTGRIGCLTSGEYTYHHYTLSWDFYYYKVGKEDNAYNEQLKISYSILPISVYIEGNYQKEIDLYPFFTRYILIGDIFSHSLISLNTSFSYSKSISIDTTISYSMNSVLTLNFPFTSLEGGIAVTYTKPNYSLNPTIKINIPAPFNTALNLEFNAAYEESLSAIQTKCSFIKNF